MSLSACSGCFICPSMSMPLTVMRSLWGDSQDAITSNITETQSYEREAMFLVNGLAYACSNKQPISSLSASIYDTAWVSMVSKKDSNTRRWLFPQCFEAILESTAFRCVHDRHLAAVDRILSTGAVLLAVLWHRNRPSIIGCSELPLDIDSRISNIRLFLQSEFETWDVESSNHVGFEVLVPALVRLLAKEGVAIGFSRKQHLQALYEQKVSGLDSGALLSGDSSTIVHSLEAYVGLVDLDQASCHLIHGSMMASPSASAAYLIYAQQWDERVERYLQGVVEHPNLPAGQVPSAFPTTNFELTWVVSTLLCAGIQFDRLTRDMLAEYIGDALNEGDGILGFAPGLLPDLDDTAKAILCLELLGKYAPSLEGAIARFEGHVCFNTYDGERDPSISANCNMLSALLNFSQPQRFIPQIKKIASFLTERWLENSITDKWNASSMYIHLLVSQAFVKLLRLFDTDVLELPEAFVRDRLLLVLVQVLTRTLRTQRLDGDWDAKCEVTAYAVITLHTLLAIPCFSSASNSITSAIDMGRRYLRRHLDHWREPCLIWIEKVTFGSSNLSHAYCLAAMNRHSDFDDFEWSSKVKAFNLSSSQSSRSISFFSSLPMFKSIPEKWTLDTSFIESSLFLKRLQLRRLDIFPRKNMAKDSYLQLIPYAWTACAAIGPKSVSSIALYEMMVLSMLNYQADEYMETVVPVLCRHDLNQARRLVSSLCQADKTTQRANKQPQAERETSPKTPNTPSMSPISEAGPLRNYVSYILDHPKVVISPASMQAELRKELETFLVAHVDQIEESLKLEVPALKSPQVTMANPSSSYFDWVRTTSANHTSCPFSFVFFLCLIGSPQKEVFATVREKYLTRDVRQHLSTMCRQYNDYGSLVRDLRERNLNSLNFPEFHSQRTPSAGEEPHPQGWTGKDELMWLAEYERECLGLTVRHLQDISDGKHMEAVELFIRVTDLFGQIYVAKDIASRMK